VQGVATDAGIPVIENTSDFAVLIYHEEGPDCILKNFVIEKSFMAIFIAGSSPTISNVTVVYNKYGIAAYAGSEPDISNCIFWNNTDVDLFGCQAQYSRTPEQGQGNVDADPCFADPGNSDYHLLSRRGRYWPEHDVWVLDKVTSPCVDGGDPNDEPADEPMPNGGRIDMGAYGGTPYASMSEWPLAGDINHDGVVDLVDMAIFCNDWLSFLPWVE
jgi:parallel beta-helix repeat protein